MRNVIALTKRNAYLFLRDKSTVFFSFLSSLILIALYFLFIAKAFSSAMMEYPESTFSESACSFLIYLQMMAGVLILNSMSLSTGVFSIIARDFENRRVDSFLLTPVHVREMLVSYYAGGFLVSFILNLFTWIASIALIGALTGYWIAAGTFMITLGILTAASLISSSLMLLITSAVKSSAAIGVISGVSGTFLGFLCGIYMPYSNLGEETEKIGSLLPFTHLTIWMKQTVLSDACSQLDITGELKSILMKEWFSAENIGFFGMNAPLWLMLIVCGIFALVCLLIAGRLLKKRITG